MEQLLETLRSLEPWTAEAMHDAYKAAAEKAEVGFGKLIHPTRLALTGKSVGPGLFELAELLGREACVKRMERAIEFVS